MARRRSHSGDEARGLFVLIRGEASSIESVRDLIAVSAEIEAVLCLCAKQHPEGGLGIQKVLRFRTLVREEFDRLVRESERPRPLVIVGAIQAALSPRRKALR